MKIYCFTYPNITLVLTWFGPHSVPFSSDDCCVQVLFLETLFLPADEMFGYVSSTLVREIAMMNGDPSPFVDPIVAKAFDGKLTTLGGRRTA